MNDEAASGAQQPPESSLLSRRTSSCLAESASAAAHGRPPGDVGGSSAAAAVQQQQHPSRLQRLESTASSAPALALPPLPPGRPRQPPASPLAVATPIEPPEGEPATPGDAPGLGLQVPPWAESPAQVCTPEAASAVGPAAATPSPGPCGLRRQMGLEVEAAGEHLHTPGPPSARGSVNPAAPAAQQGEQRQGLPPAPQGLAGEREQQQQQQQRLEEQRPQQEGQAERGEAAAEVVGEELPSALLEVRLYALQYMHRPSSAVKREAALPAPIPALGKPTCCAGPPTLPLSPPPASLTPNLSPTPTPLSTLLASGGRARLCRSQQCPSIVQCPPAAHPPSRRLPQAASRARELLGTLRRGPRLFLAARRGPGDFVGEMEALSEHSALRRAPPALPFPPSPAPS
jgi:hypothetical protein